MEPTAAANSAWKIEMRLVHRTVPKKKKNLSFNQPPGGADAVMVAEKCLHAGPWRCSGRKGEKKMAGGREGGERRNPGRRQLLF